MTIPTSTQGAAPTVTPPNAPDSHFRELARERKRALWTWGIVGGAVRDSS